MVTNHPTHNVQTGQTSSEVHRGSAAGNREQRLALEEACQHSECKRMLASLTEAPRLLDFHKVSLILHPWGGRSPMTHF